MTQALFDSLNSIQTTLSNERAADKVATSDMGKTNEFQKVFDSQNNEVSSQSSPSTIGDIKNSTTTNGSSSDKLAELKKILEDATRDANEESALDLTLAKDINDVISQLKDSLDYVDESTDKTEDETSEGLALVDPSLLFEQVLSCINKDEVALPQVNVENTDDLNTVTDEVIELVSETVSDDSEVTESGEDITTTLDDEAIKELNIESIEAETDSEMADDSLMNKQSAEEHSVKAMLNQDSVTFDLKVDKPVEAQNPQASAKPVEISSNKIIEQITKQMEGLYNNSKVNIVLNPESLGKVNIQLINTKDGLTAQFMVTTQDAKDLLTKGLDGLRESLTAHGVGVENVSVKLNNTQKSENNQNWTEQDGSRGGNKGQDQPNREEKEKGLFEKMMAQTEDNKNGSV